MPTYHIDLNNYAVKRVDTLTLDYLRSEHLKLRSSVEALNRDNHALHKYRHVILDILSAIQNKYLNRWFLYSFKNERDQIDEKKMVYVIIDGLDKAINNAIIEDLLKGIVVAQAYFIYVKANQSNKKSIDLEYYEAIHAAITIALGQAEPDINRLKQRLEQNVAVLFYPEMQADTREQQIRELKRSIEERDRTISTQEGEIQQLKVERLALRDQMNQLRLELQAMKDDIQELRLQQNSSRSVGGAGTASAHDEDNESIHGRTQSHVSSASTCSSKSKRSLTKSLTGWMGKGNKDPGETASLASSLPSSLSQRSKHSSSGDADRKEILALK